MNVKKKQFRQLQKEWYKKLKDDGFDDIEPINNTPFLKRHQYKTQEIYWAGKDRLGEEYFRLASIWYWHGDFDSDWDRWVWLKHSEGRSEREIVGDLKDQPHLLSTSRFPINCSLVKSKANMLSKKLELEEHLSNYDYSTLNYQQGDTTNE